MNNYSCAKCGTFIQAQSSPNSNGCPVKIDSSTSHRWSNLGAVGINTYQCSKCGGLVKADTTPSSNGCSVKRDSSTSHSWSKIATGEKEKTPKIEKKTAPIVQKETVIVEKQSESRSESKREQSEQHSSSSTKKGGAVEWDKSLLGASVNLIGKGVKAGANKAAEYNSEEAKQLREIKRQQKEEERERAEIEERKQAGIRKAKADKFREDGKPLTAFLVEMNPTYLILGAVIIATALIIGGKKFGIFFVGGIATLLAVFLGFLIKDFFKLNNKKGYIITLTLAILSISVTIGKYFYTNNKPSPATAEVNNQENVSQIETQPAVKEETNQTEKVVEPNTEENSITTKVEGNFDNIKGNWTGTFGKDQLTINIESIDENGIVKGYDQVKETVRILTGTKKDNSFILNEPGDDKWDGVFTFEFNDKSNTLVGNWKSNNGKSNKEFTLSK